MTEQRPRSVIPGPPPMPKLKTVIYIDVKCTNSKFTKWNQSFIGQWDSTARKFSDGKGEYKADLWLDNMKERISNEFKICKDHISIRFRKADAPKSQKNKQPSCLDRWCYSIVYPTEDKLFAYIEGMIFLQITCLPFFNMCNIYRFL